MANTFVSLRRLQRFYNGLKNKFALKSEVPSKTSDLTNDSGFLTSHQDISGKVNVYQGTTNQNKYLGINELGNVEPRNGLTVTDNDGTVTIVSGVDISGGGGSSITVDSEFSATSINPVQNKVITGTLVNITEELGNKASTDIATTTASGLMSATDKTNLDTLYADYLSASTALG